ncbi:hypothetical protein KZZ07_17380 [Mameliella sp. CS4]|uniref:hypothetical protein n=1 Tax=Mameliella sp. CS4 TaxID=2862329 RepID=UPI001C5D8E4F|nr:hypothetical protein [Mameliella sp. CS4]MBW4984315.1 hypothetical protein [Mameliella sp. CS4]
MLRSEEVHVADAARGGLGQEEPPARHRSRSVMCQKLLGVRVAPRFRAALLDMSALDLVNRAVDRIAVVFAPSIRGAKSLQTGMCRTCVDPERIPDVCEGFARKRGLHRTHANLLVGREALSSLGEAGNAAVDRRLLEVAGFDLHLHPGKEPFAKLVDGVLRRLGFLVHDQLQPSPGGKVMVLEILVVRTHRDGDPLRLLPFNANTPARCPRRRFLFTKALIGLLDLHIPSSQDRASSASALILCPLVVIRRPDGA